MGHLISKQNNKNDLSFLLFCFLFIILLQWCFMYLDHLSVSLNFFNKKRPAKAWGLRARACVSTRLYAVFVYLKRGCLGFLLPAQCVISLPRLWRAPWAPGGPDTTSIRQSFPPLLSPTGLPDSGNMSKARPVMSAQQSIVSGCESLSGLWILLRAMTVFTTHTHTQTNTHEGRSPHPLQHSPLSSAAARVFLHLFA